MVDKNRLDWVQRMQICGRWFLHVQHSAAMAISQQQTDVVGDMIR